MTFKFSNIPDLLSFLRILVINNKQFSLSIENIYCDDSECFDTTYIVIIRTSLA